MKKVLNIILITIPVVIILVLLVFMLERNKKIDLPTPTGNYGIGRITYEWSDTARIDTLASEPGTRRELFLWVWYPTTKNNTNSTSEYIPEEWRKAISERQGRFARFFRKKLSKIHAFSVEGAKLPSEKKQYPIVIMKSGIGASTTDYTSLAEDLASNGYIVIGSDSPYSSNVVVFSDGRIINDNAKGNPSNAGPSVDRNRRLDRLVTLWTDDIRFIMDKLEQINSSDSTNLFYQRLNLKEMGVLGHALGGATAFRFCFDDPRCKAGVSINGIPFGNVNQNKLSKPFMFLMADQIDEPDSVKLKVKRNIDTIYIQLPETSVWINLKGAKHYNFNDQSLIREHFIAKKAGDIGPIEKRRGLQIAISSVRVFLDVNLKGLPFTKIKELQNKYPELEFVQ